MTPALVLCPVIIMGLILALFVPVTIRLFKKTRLQDITPEWFESFSVSSYYPMENLLSEEDFKFLSRQPGFDLSLYRKLRRDRLHIFKQYLSRAIVDFNRLHTAACVLVPLSQTDSSELVGRLFRLKLRFSYAVLKAQFSYCLCVLGYRSLAVRELILHLEEMSSQLSTAAAQAS